MRSFLVRSNVVALIASCLATAACGSETIPAPDPKEPGGTQQACASSTQEEALDCLGVVRTDEPRIDLKGVPLPESYAPLGATRAFGVSQELFFVGMQLAPPVPVGSPEVLDNRAALLELSDDATGAVGPGILDAIPPGKPWETDTHTEPAWNGGTGAQSARAAVAADLDGQGVDQIVVFYLDHDDPANAGVVFAETVGGGEPIPVATAPGAEDLVAVRADVDGDGLDEIALGIAGADEAVVFVVRLSAEGDLAAVVGSEQTLSQTLAGGSLSLELAAGNIDRDGGDEIAIVLNEYDLPAQVASSSYSIVDDEEAGFAALVTGAPMNVADQGNFQADVMDVAIGDVDGDGKGEIVFGGLETMLEQTCTAYRHLYLALDDAGDAPAPLAPIGQRADLVQYVPSSGCSEVSSKLIPRHVFVHTLDVDGDGVDEVQANLRVFDDLREAPFEELYAIDPAVLAGPDGLGGGILATGTTSMTTGDIDGDGREEIVIFAQHRSEVVVWGLDGFAADSAVFREITRMDTATYNFQSDVDPIIVPANVDSDGVILKYSEAEHEFVFTEPIVIAALAAAPCAEGIGQNTAACTTAYGTSEGTSGGADASVTVSASTFVSFEAKAPLTEIGVEGKATLSVSASLSAGKAYSLEESVEYTTGPIEDTVIFTTLPLDQYSYTVVLHPDPSKVGEKIVVSVPRTPITLQVERSFYNESVVPGSMLIDDKVFFHTPGDIPSYPTEGDADALISTGGLAHLGPLGELVDAAGEALGPLAEKLLGRGLKTSKAITVGQGAGQTSTQIAFTDETEYQAGLEIGYEKELAVTGGGFGVEAGVGASLGGSVGAALSWGSSTSTVYRGTIGSLDASSFADHVYSTGVFTYIYNYDNEEAPQFEVVHYWVDE
jgi:hypothetical protein